MHPRVAGVGFEAIDRPHLHQIHASWLHYLLLLFAKITGRKPTPNSGAWQAMIMSWQPTRIGFAYPNSLLLARSAIRWSQRALAFRMLGTRPLTSRESGCSAL